MANLPVTIAWIDANWATAGPVARRATLRAFAVTSLRQYRQHVEGHITAARLDGISAPNSAAVDAYVTHVSASYLADLDTNVEVELTPEFDGGPLANLIDWINANWDTAPRPRKKDRLMVFARMVHRRHRLNEVARMEAIRDTLTGQERARLGSYITLTAPVFARPANEKMLIREITDALYGEGD